MPQALIRDVKKFYKTDARRHLPWRKTHDPYKVLVSEVMLQQTQVERVIPYYERWMKAFPTAEALSRATLPQALTLWQGLGYNRRGKYLWESGKVLASAETFLEKVLGSPVSRPKRSRARLFSGKVSAPLRDIFAEGKLPGVGPYTAAAVRAFAFNEPAVFIETNIRTVFFYYLKNKKVMSDKELLPLVGEALTKSRMEPRDFYAALMDYGSHLKRQGVRLNQKSRHYRKQSKFEGSARQKRAANLRELLGRGASEAQIRKALDSK